MPLSNDSTCPPVGSAFAERTRGKRSRPHPCALGRRSAANLPGAAHEAQKRRRTERAGTGCLRKVAPAPSRPSWAVAPVDCGCGFREAPYLLRTTWPDPGTNQLPAGARALCRVRDRRGAGLLQRAHRRRDRVSSRGGGKGGLAQREATNLPRAGRQLSPAAGKEMPWESRGVCAQLNLSTESCGSCPGHIVLEAFILFIARCILASSPAPRPEQEVGCIHFG